MKVKIGSYPDHRWYHNYLHDWFGYLPKAKVKVKIDKYDTWSMDTTLAHIVIPMLYQLAKTKHGSPMVDNEDVPLELRMTHEDTIEGQLVSHDIDDGVHERWDWVMTEMIFAFESKLTNWEDKYSSGEINYDSISVIGKDGTEIGISWEKGAGHTYKLDIDGLHAEQARIANGFRLFGKYYEGLWD